MATKKKAAKKKAAAAGGGGGGKKPAAKAAKTKQRFLTPKNKFNSKAAKAARAKAEGKYGKFLGATRELDRAGLQKDLRPGLAGGLFGDT